jgi:hypothetical protein
MQTSGTPQDLRHRPLPGGAAALGQPATSTAYAGGASGSAYKETVTG